MSARLTVGALVLCMLLAGCRDEGLVGEGSACAEACSSDESCVNGACVPLTSGAAGDDSDAFDEDDRDHDGPDRDGFGDNEGPGGDGSGDDHSGAVPAP